MNPPDESAMPATLLWQGGWYRFGRAMASPNYGARPDQAPIDLIVIHSISLPPGEFGNYNVQRLFTNQLDWNAHPYFQLIGGQYGLKVSSHFFISRLGELWQFVSCDARAWHAGPSIYRGLSNCNDTSIGIELEGLEGQSFEAPQYETLSALSSALMVKYPVAHFAGHEHIAPGRKQDPGPGFKWCELERSLGLQAKNMPNKTCN